MKEAVLPMSNQGREYRGVCHLPLEVRQAATGPPEEPDVCYLHLENHQDLRMLKQPMVGQKEKE